MTAEDTLQALARAITDSINGRRWRDMTPRDVAQAVLDSGLAAPAAPVDGEDELAVMLRRAAADPGQYTMRYKDSDGDYELLHLWQARAAMIAVRPLLAARDAAVQLAETRFSFGTAAIKDRDRAEARIASLRNSTARSVSRAVQAEADLAAARQQLDQVREAVTEYMDALGGQVPLYYRERIQAVIDAAPVDEAGGAT